MRKNLLVTNDPEKYLAAIEQDFEEMIYDGVCDEEIVEYIKMVLPLAKPCKNSPDAWFWMFDEPSSMPSDCRVAFVYEPTYMITGMIIYSLVTVKEAKNIPGIMDTLRKVLNGCMGRNFAGHGYDEERGFINAMEIFGICRVVEFFNEYAETFPEFYEFFLKRAEQLFRMNISNDTALICNEILYMLKEGAGNKLVFIYGSMMKDGKNHEEFMSDSKYIGKYELTNYATVETSNDEAGIKACTGEKVIGEVYEMSLQDVIFLDEFFAEGFWYLRKGVTVQNKDGKLNVHTFVYND